MEKEFIPYEQALELNELGFDEPCFGKYLSSLQSDWKVYELILEMGMNEEFEDNRNTYLLEEACSSPTYSQAFRWFREKYGYNCFITSSKLDGKWYYFREDLDDRWNDSEPELTPKFDSFEESELACLKKLIEIVKEK